MFQPHHRTSIRLRNVDYSLPGYYFVTICTRDRECLFGNVVEGEVRLSDWGKVVKKIWETLPEYFINIIIDEFIVMPNHFHGIIEIVDNYRRGGVSPPQSPTASQLPTTSQLPPTMAQPSIFDNNDVANEGGETPPLREVQIRPTLGQIVAYFKYQTTKIINVDVQNSVKIKIWQRNYYEHIIRNDKSLQNIRAYIQGNPWNWNNDIENEKLRDKYPPTEYEKMLKKYYLELVNGVSS